MDINPQKIPSFGCYVGLPRLNCLHRRYCIFVSVKVKYTKFTWQAARDCLCAFPQFSFTKSRRRNFEPYGEGWLLTCRSNEISELVYPFQSLVSSWDQSLSTNGQTVLKEMCYWYSSDKRIAGQLRATEPSAWGGWAQRGFHSCMDLFCQRKDKTVLCAWAGAGVMLLEHATALHISGVEDMVLSVVCCTKNLHLFFLFFVEGLAGRETEAKNSWEDNEGKATHLLSENIYKYNCHCHFIRMFLLYL